MSGFQTPITIADAIKKIDSHDYLLPSIQRKFVWSAYQIETLFDSIMRGYPINSFMFWNITDKKIKQNFKFYQFLDAYRDFFKVDNPDFDAINKESFYAVIDGQQRLTSLYIGLKGTYAYKMPRKWWVDNEDALPTRRLYLNLSSVREGLQEDDFMYNFVFLTQQEYEKITATNDKWMLVRDILGFSSFPDIITYTMEHNLNKNESDVLATLFQRIHQDKLINYYLEENQDIDAVLDIFIRTNSGGTPLSFSNLLMSITIANWSSSDGSDARKALADLVQEIYAIGKPGFMISEDFILKTCLVLFSDNIKFNVKNFDASTVQQFSDNWLRIRKCIVEAFRLLESWGFNNSSLRAKNAVIPIIYYIYHHQFENGINNQTRLLDEKNAIKKWLCIAILKGIFGGQTDAILTKIKKVLQANANQQMFPLEQIVDEFRGQERNFGFDEDFIENLLQTQKDDSVCYSILALLYSHKPFDAAIKYHKDHLHPAVSFSEKRLIEVFGTKEQIPAIYLKPECWNSIVNLQLLDGSLNESKNDEPLQEWLDTHLISKAAQLIPEDVSCDFKDFELFYSKRKQLLIRRIKEVTQM
ncbi:MAG: DUF262 domain-containing protein [Bacteroidales bacterium]|nr:DUF262 domain-containing protein [Bacteroidales bacterium]MDD7528184.1 DUF262 domain-containing protein [Bacteroidales bacterium]